MNGIIKIIPRRKRKNIKMCKRLSQEINMLYNFFLSQK